MKKIIIITILSAILLSAAAIAQPGPNKMNCQKECCNKPMMMNHDKMNHQKMNRHQMGIEMILRHVEELNLTDQQKDKLQKLKTDFKLAQVDLKAKMEKEEIMLKSLMKDENASESSVYNGIDKISQLKAEMMKARYAHRKDIHAVLTDEQNEKVKTLIKARKSSGKNEFDDIDGFGQPKNFKKHGR